MKTIEKYVANDGAEFDNPEKCTKYEKMLLDIQGIMSALPKRPKSTNFSNGEGYIQHNESTFLRVENEFYKFACKYHKINQTECPKNSWIFWRTLDDSGSNFYLAGQRFLCTDRRTLREYGQPYYANHPEQIEGGRRNP